MDIAVIGGGIGGLGCAIALRRAGHDVTVTEQASRIGEVGAGFALAPNGMRMIDRLGLRPAVEAIGAPYGDRSRYYRSDGEVVGGLTTEDSSGEYGTWGLHRADMVDTLLAALPADVIRTGHRLTGIQEDDRGVHLEFEDAEAIHADLAIGADGIHSFVRHAVTTTTEPVPAGSKAYRGLVPIDRLPGWPTEALQLWMGDGKHFLTYPVRAGRLLNYVAFVPSEEHLRESWSAVGDVESLRRDFADWDPRVEQVLSQVETTFWWGLYDREPLPRWSSERVTLLGDAAHAMLPHLGQGANQAIEDGMALAALLRGVEADGIAPALAAYEQLRRDRTSAVQRGARDNGRRYDSAYDDLSERDREIRSARDFRLWLYDYDAEAAAEEIVAHR